MVLDVLTRFKTSEIGKAVSSLDNDQKDILMKYIYRGFAEPTENSCGTLLVWQEKVSRHTHSHMHTHAHTHALTDSSRVWAGIDRPSDDRQKNSVTHN